MRKGNEERDEKKKEFEREIRKRIYIYIYGYFRPLCFEQMDWGIYDNLTVFRAIRLPPPVSSCSHLDSPQTGH